MPSSKSSSHSAGTTTCWPLRLWGTGNTDILWALGGIVLGTWAQGLTKRE